PRIRPLRPRVRHGRPASPSQITTDAISQTLSISSTGGSFLCLLRRVHEARIRRPTGLAVRQDLKGAPPFSRCPVCQSVRIVIVVSPRRRAFCTACGAKWVQEGSEQRAVQPGPLSRTPAVRQG